jgi:hypothetical protein
MRYQGSYILNQVINLIITTIAIGLVAGPGFFFLATTGKTGDFLMIIATLAEQDGYRFKHSFAIMHMHRKPGLRKQDYGSQDI